MSHENPFADHSGYLAMRAHRAEQHFVTTTWLVSLLVTAVAIGLAWSDRSWGALWIAFIGAPAVNAFTFVVASIVLWICRRKTPAMKSGVPMLAAVFAPLTSSIVVLAVVFSMSLHGC